MIDPEDQLLVLVLRRVPQVAQARHRLSLEEAEAALALREWKEFSTEKPDPLVLRQPQLTEANKALEAAKAAQEQAATNKERTEIKAPFDGRVSEKYADEGQVVGAGTPIAKIYAVDFAEVRLPIPDRDLPYLDLPLDYRGEEKPAEGPKVDIRSTFAGKSTIPGEGTSCASRPRSTREHAWSPSWPR